MITTNRHIVTILMFALLACVVCFGQKPPSAKPNCDEFVFSDVHHVPEADDYVGTEIVLNLCPGVDDLQGAWNEYEGYHPATTNLNGSHSGKAIRLRGENSEGKVEFVGRLDGDRLTGKLVWHIGSSRQEKNINLVRKQCPVRPPK
jgi:hypothetical protein